MTLAQRKADKRYKDKHKEHYRQLSKDYYQKNKEQQLEASRKRTREITAGARRWRKIAGPGPRYWIIKNKSDITCI